MFHDLLRKMVPRGVDRAYRRGCGEGDAGMRSVKDLFGWPEDAFDWIVTGSIIIGLTIGAVFFTVVMYIAIYAAGNSAFLDTMHVMGAVADISFMPQHQEWVSHGKTHSLDTIPDKWYLNIETPDGYDWMSIQHAPWTWQQKGKRVDVDYHIGRLDHKVRIETIRTVSP